MPEAGVFVRYVTANLVFFQPFICQKVVLLSQFTTLGDGCLGSGNDEGRR